MRASVRRRLTKSSTRLAMPAFSPKAWYSGSVPAAVCAQADVAAHTPNSMADMARIFRITDSLQQFQTRLEQLAGGGFLGRRLLRLLIQRGVGCQQCTHPHPEQAQAPAQVHPLQALA